MKIRNLFLPLAAAALVAGGVSAPADAATSQFALQGSCNPGLAPVTFTVSGHNNGDGTNTIDRIQWLTQQPQDLESRAYSASLPTNPRSTVGPAGLTGIGSRQAFPGAVVADGLFRSVRMTAQEVSTGRACSVTLFLPRA